MNPFPDHTLELFGRSRDVDSLLQRAEKPGFTAITGRPRLGKTWLLLEVARNLVAQGCLLGYHECRAQSPDLLLRAVSDLYSRWLAEARFWDEARSLWSRHKGSLTSGVGVAVGRVLKAVSKMKALDPIKIGDLVASTLDGLVMAQQDLKTGGLVLTRLDYDQAQKLVKTLTSLSKSRIVLILDSWEKSPSVDFEYHVLDRFLKRIDDWPRCHIFAAIRKPETALSAGPDRAYELARDLAASDPSATLHPLEPMKLADENEQQRMLQTVHSDFVPARLLADDDVVKLVDGYPGVLEHWRKALIRNEIHDARSLRDLAADAQQYRYREFEWLLPPLDGAQQRLAIRLAVLPRLDEDSWRALKETIEYSCDGAQEAIDQLRLAGVLDTSRHPTYGHDTRHTAARRWYLGRAEYRPLVARETESLVFALAARHRRVDEATRVVAEVLSSLRTPAEELQTHIGAVAITRGACSLFGEGDLASDPVFDSGWRAGLERSANVGAFVALLLVNRGISKREAGDIEGAIADFATAIEMPGTPRDQTAKTINQLAISKYEAGDPEGAIIEFTAVIDMPDAPPEQRAEALFNRGLTKDQVGDAKGAIADYTTVIEMPDASPRHKAAALVSRGVSKGKAGDNKGRIADYTAVIDMPDATAELIAKALYNRGFCKGQDGDREGEIVDYTAVVDMPDAPTEQKAAALNSRGISKFEAGDSNGAITDFTTVIEMPSAPCEQIAKALTLRGISKADASDTEGAIADYTAVIDMPDAGPEQRTDALIKRGRSMDKAGNAEGAIADYTAAIDLADRFPKLKAEALLGRGRARGEAGDAEGTISDYTAVIDTTGSPPELKAEALLGRGSVRGENGDTEGAIDDFNAVIDMPGCTPGHQSTAVYNRACAKALAGDSEGSVADYTTVIKMAGNLPELKAEALYNLAFSKVQAGDVEGGIADYTAVIDMPGADPAKIADALYERGSIRIQAGDIEGGIADYSAIIDMPCADPAKKTDALYQRGMSKLKAGDVEGSIDDYSAVINMPNCPIRLTANALLRRMESKLAAGDIEGARSDFIEHLQWVSRSGSSASGGNE